MSDLREQMLDRLQAVIATIVPGVVFTYPFGYGATPRAMESDLGGGTDPVNARVYSKMRAMNQPDLNELPLVIIAASEPDTVVALDDQMFERTVGVQLWGYTAGDDAGDDLDAVVRPGLNALAADLQVAIEAFPYWTDTGANATPLYITHGPVTITAKTQHTEPAVEQPLGMLMLDYSISFKFHRLNP